ncbi:putative phenylacetic acid degradation NADH oxidoreductase PaaE [Streptomyces sp. Tu6071]|nr:putative phenylacetic acid degradation NADH oxidoreductase PaaE [Streptomyces sp. Tu6071]
MRVLLGEFLGDVEADRDGVLAQPLHLGDTERVEAGAAPCGWARALYGGRGHVVLLNIYRPFVRE